MFFRFLFILFISGCFAQYAEADWQQILSSQGVQQESRQKALLIGVSRYKNSDGRILTNLAGPVNDVRMLRDEFVQPVLGFAADEIVVLEDEAASRDVIWQIMENWFLQGEGVKKRFFFFAGHGSNIEDLNDDEAGDLDDEIILPYDADFDKQGNWLPNTILIDDQWREWFEQIKGRKLIAMLDTCHSGSGFRSLGSQGAKSLTRSRFAGTRGKLTKNRRRVVPLAETPIPDSHVYLYASKSSQRAFEREFNGKVHGCFSQALVRGTQRLNREVKPGETISWDRFFNALDDRMRNTMNLDQSPDIEPPPGDKRLAQTFYAVPESAGRPAANRMVDTNSFRIKVKIEQDKGLLKGKDLTELADFADIDWQGNSKGSRLHIMVDSGRNRVELSNENGYLLGIFNFSDKAELIQQLDRRIRQAYLWGLLTEIESARQLPLDIVVLDSKGAAYKRNDFYIGQTISYAMTGRKKGYLYMLGLDGSGRLDLLYPISCQQDNRIERESNILLPDPAQCGKNIVWELEGDPGEELIKFFVSEQPIHIEIPAPADDCISCIEFDEALKIVRDLVKQLQGRDDWYSGERRYFKYKRQEYDSLYQDIP